MPLERWLEDFQRDHHPEREVAIYEAMARAYAGFVHGRTLSIEAKKEVYKILLMRSATSPDEVLKTVTLATLSPDEARALVLLYDAPPQPITFQRAQPW